MNTGQTIAFPKYSGIRCLMMPYIQGESTSVPAEYAAYANIVDSVFLRKGELGFLTIDESPAVAGKPHRGARAKYGRALHTEAGIDRAVLRWGDEPYRWGSQIRWGSPEHRWGAQYRWGGGPRWGGGANVTLDRDVEILLANNLDDSCATWDAEHEDTSLDGDIGYAAASYPYESANFMLAGEVHRIGILTPHESLPVERDCERQFLRIVGSGVHGREEYFTRNPLMCAAAIRRGEKESPADP